MLSSVNIANKFYLIDKIMFNLYEQKGHVTRVICGSQLSGIHM
jgi:hypothetical protein